MVRIRKEELANNGEPHTTTTYFCDACNDQLLKTVSSPFAGCYITYYKDGKICKCGKYKVFSWNKPLGFKYSQNEHPVVVADGYQDVVIQRCE